MTKVAVITRTKDRAIFLKRALQSVANQTYQDYTHVIVNDGGDKQTIETLLDELSENQRSKTILFHRPISSGAPDTIFNESIDRVDSKYFAIHDDDDSWHESFLERTVSHLEANDDLGAAVVPANKVLEAVEGGYVQQKKTTQWMPDLKAISLYRQCIDNQFTPIATLFRRSAYESVGRFDDTLPVVGDWEFGVRLLTYFDAEIIESSHALAYYHHRTSSDNSFTQHSHRYYTNKVINRYLRKELVEGKLGVGYIMGQLKYNQANIYAQIKSILPNFVVRQIKKRRQ